MTDVLTYTIQLLENGSCGQWKGWMLQTFSYFYIVDDVKKYEIKGKQKDWGPQLYDPTL